MPSQAPTIPRRARPERVSRTREAPPSDIADDSARAFLEDILLGETAWRLSDVRRLMELHTLISVGRWHADGLDSAPVSDPAR